MKTIIPIILLLLSVLSYGQWTPLNVNMNSNFVDVQFLNDSVGFVTGSNGAILKTTDHGLSWINTNNTGNTSAFRIHFPGDSVGYGLALNNLFKTVDQGVTWFALPAFNTFDKKNLFFLNDSTGFFISGYGGVDKTTDGGMNWNPLNTNCTGTLAEEDIFFADPNTGYFGGWYSTCASRTTDGGNTWLVLPNNLLYVIKSIYFTSVSTGYMTGWNSSQTEGIEKTSDSGNTWVMLNTPSWSYTSIYCTDSNTCYAVGPYGVISKTTDGGINWQQQSSGTIQALTKIYCTDANTCYAVGDSGVVLKTVNGGVTGLTDYAQDLSDINLFPNPVSDKLTINLSSDKWKEIFISDVMDKLIIHQDADSSVIKIDVSELEQGVYFLQMKGKSGMEVRRFIKL